MTVYWLDADACIQAKDEKNGAFPFSRGQKFWDYLSHQVDLGVVRSPRMVYDEITDRGWNDQLSEWFREREGRGLCVNPTDDVWECVHEISNYVVAKYGDRLARPFLNGADLWVLAHAKAMRADGVVVSHEGTREPKTRVKIPAVCQVLGIEKVNLFQMLNRLDWRM